jgi:uncharacterized RDD family membrane protein YckC
MDLRRLVPTDAISDWLRGSDSVADLLFRLSVLSVLVLAFSYVLLAVAAVALLVAAVDRLLVRGDGRPIRGGSGPTVRGRTRRRVAARVVDLAVVVPPAAAVAALAPLPGPWARSVAAGATTAYFVGGVALAGSTPGRALAGLGVETTVGADLSPGQALVRETLGLLGLLAFPLTAYVVLRNPNGEHAGDLAADTVVVDRSPAGIDGLRAYVGMLRRSRPHAAGSGQGSSGRPSKHQGSSGRPSKHQGSSGRPSKHQGSSGGSSRRTSSTRGPAKRRSSGRPSKRQSSKRQSSRGGSATQPSARPGGSGSGSGSGGATRCPDCGHGVADDVRYCPDCGAYVG